MRMPLNCHLSVAVLRDATGRAEHAVGSVRDRPHLPVLEGAA
jgi:hypothetical protein